MRTLDPCRDAPVQRAATVDAFAAGATVLVGDRGDPVVFLAAAADRIDAAGLERIQRLAGGMTVLGLGDSHVARLGLEPLPAGRRELPLELTAPIDAAHGIEGGWSAEDRAHTMRLAARAQTDGGELTVPGHVQIARIGATATPAAAGALALALALGAGRPPAVVLGAVTVDGGAFATLEQARRRAELRALPHASSAEARGDALARASAGRLVACELPTRGGPFRALALDPGAVTDSDHGAALALVHGDPADRAAPLVHVHRACLLGDTFGSLICDCRDELSAAEDAIIHDGAGVIVYVKPGRTDPHRRFHCGRETPLDRAPVLALLSACGITLAGEPLAGEPPERWFTRLS